MECQTLGKTLNIQREIKEIQSLFLEWNLKRRQAKQAVRKHEVIEVYMGSTVSKKVPRREMPLGSNPRFQFVGCYLLDNKILCFLNEDFPLYFISGLFSKLYFPSQNITALDPSEFPFSQNRPKITILYWILEHLREQRVILQGVHKSISIPSNVCRLKKYCILSICWAKMQLPYWLVGTSVILFTKCSEQHHLFTHSIYKIYMNAIVIITCKFM